MSNEEKIVQLLMELKSDVNQLKQGQMKLESDFSQLNQGQMELKSDVTQLKQGQMNLEQSLVKIENDQGMKISALFDGYTLRGDQIESLQIHLDERLDAIQTDVSYVVGKIAQHDRSIVHLNKIAK